MSNLENELKAAFALLDMSNFKWLTDAEAKKLPPLTKTGSMQVPLNQETFEGMQAASVFTGHWKTQTRKVMKKARLFRIEISMYEVGFSKPAQAFAVMKQPGTVHTLWKAVDKASKVIMSENEGKDWDENKCRAVVKV